MENIIAYIIVAFAAFCMVAAFIKQLRSDGSDKGGCSGHCGACASKRKDGQEKCKYDDKP